MNVNINNKNLFSQSLLINKFFFQKNFSHKQTGITTLDSGCQYRNNNYYYNKDGVPFLSKEQADRCINGKDWKKIVSVSDKVKSDLEKVVKQDFISSNGAYIPEESKRHDVIKQYLNTIPSEQRNSASWTLSRMAGDYASRMETLVKKNNPGWKPGDAFDTSILNQMEDTLCGLDFKVQMQVRKIQQVAQLEGLRIMKGDMLIWQLQEQKLMRHIRIVMAIHKMLETKRAGHIRMPMNIRTI